MAEKYFGWIGSGGYKNVILVKEGGEAYFFNRAEKAFERNDEFAKAQWDPGSDFEEITKEEAEKVIERLKG